VDGAPVGHVEVRSRGTVHGLDRRRRRGTITKDILQDMRNSGPEEPVSSGMGASDAAHGDISRLLQTLRPDLVRFAHWLARDRAIAEDIVQESMLRAWRSRESLKDATSARAWLLTIVRREHARLYERKRLELVCLDDEIDHHALATGDDTDLQTLRAAILRLPMEYREPLIMQVLGGFSTDEIARELSLSASAVLTRLFRARNKLRAIYGLAPSSEPAAAGDVL
jgi:RNA polymerase sigma-70 factor, ECF subfamily